MASHPAPFVLASALASYPREDLPATVPLLLEDIAADLPEALGALLRDRVTADAIPDLQSEYIDLFDAGRQANPLCETEYDRRRALAKGNELADIAGFYRAFGFALDPALDGMEMADHIGLELEFYALMLMKETALSEAGDAEGVSITAEARGKFLASHLGRFARALSRRPGVASSAFYGPLFAWVADLLEEECRRLGVAAEPADWIEAEAMKDGELACGQAGSCAPAAP